MDVFDVQLRGAKSSTPRLYFSLGVLSVLARLEPQFSLHLASLGSILAPFGSILELLGLHLASQGLPLGTVGSLWAAGCPQEGFSKRKAGSLDPPWAPILESFLVKISMKFLLIFVYVFWITFGAILEQFWEPEWIQNRLKIDSKFDQQFSRILEWFLDHL